MLPLIRDCAGSVPTGIAVQWGNYEFQNPNTGKPVTIPELLEFGGSYLKVNYIFRCAQGAVLLQEAAPAV
ncbi:MAG TPA: hypothetical protein VNZ64_20885 [Candidatus Acidoferrum sp.]|nr:hypothetical protein [Candidatus Acidoferrum sp.]